MRVVKKNKILLLMIVAMLFVQNANATPLLPESSLYEGISYFGVGRVEFAVYDTLAIEPDELGFEAPGTGQYIYAYQIFLDAGASEAIDFFGIPGLNTNAFTAPMNDNIGSADDGSGIAPDESPYIALYDGGAAGAWEFDDNGPLTAGEHSWILLLRSDQSWTPGSYSFNNREDLTNKIPIIKDGDGNPVPEPVTIALFGIGSLMILSKRRKSV